MRKSTLVATATALVVGLGACRSNASRQSVDAHLTTGEGTEWTGVIHGVQTRNGSAVPNELETAYQGNVLLTRWDQDTTRTSVYVHLSTPERNASISWVLATDRCGAIEAPVLPISSFDPLDVGSDGRAEVTTHIAFEFPTDGSYHVDFFGGNAARLSAVVACADLKMRKK